MNFRQLLLLFISASSASLSNLHAWTKWETVLTHPKQYFTQCKRVMHNIITDSNTGYACFLAFTGLQSTYCGAHAVAQLNYLLNTPSTHTHWFKSTGLGIISVSSALYTVYALSFAIALALSAIKKSLHNIASQEQ